MVVDEVSCRVIVKVQELRNLGCWSWILLRVNKNIGTIIVTAYCSTLCASAGGAYSQQLKSLKIVKIHGPRPQFGIYLNTKISKWIHEVKQIILLVDWNSEALEINTCMETQGLTNTICNLHRYADAHRILLHIKR